MSERRGKQAARTTIVGGQPPGAEREIALVPAGIEELLGMAAAERTFAEALRRDRWQAIEASGVRLSVSEQELLESVDATTLSHMVERLTLGEQDRRYFVTRAAAAVLALAGGAAAGAAGCERHTGSEPTGRPDAALPGRQPTARPTTIEAETGLRPAGPLPSLTPKGGIRPDRPDAGRPHPTRGIRPDRPRTRGIQPDWPRDLKSPFDMERKKDEK